MRTHRKFRSFRRRRRAGGETYTIGDCRHCVNVYNDTTCSNPNIDMIELMTMGSPRSPIVTDPVTVAADKHLRIRGIRFQSEFLHDPAQSLQCFSCDPAPADLAFVLTIWEAIIVLPLSQGGQAPEYLPNLTNAGSQKGDLADRVLWKRQSYLPIWGINVPAGNTFPQLEGTFRDTAAGPQEVRSKVSLDDRHGLYYVKNYVHDVFIGSGSSSTDCFVASDCSSPNKCSIPILNDCWFKIFWTSSKR